jgi:hypothetical protein
MAPEGVIVVGPRQARLSPEHSEFHTTVTPEEDF